MIQLGIVKGTRIGPVGRGHEEGIGQDTFHRWEAYVVTIEDVGAAKSNVCVVVTLREDMPPTHKLFNSIMHRRVAMDVRTSKAWYVGGGA